MAVKSFQGPRADSEKAKPANILSAGYYDNKHRLFQGR